MADIYVRAYRGKRKVFETVYSANYWAQIARVVKEWRLLGCRVVVEYPPL